MESDDFIVLNGRAPGDTPARFTFSATNGNSVIDLVWVNLFALDFIRNVFVRDDVASTSDHFPVQVSLKMPVWQPFRILEYKSIRWLTQF